nr:hypothetical protein [Halomonas sp.]
MKNIIPSTLIFTALAISGCAMDNQPSADNFERISTEAQFVEVMQRGAVLGGGGIVTLSENRWTVIRDDSLIAEGTWEWDAGRWCRTGSMATGAQLARECQIYEISGNQLRITSPGNRVQLAELVQS